VASSKREKELARQRAARQAARRAERERKRKQRTAIVASVLAVALVAGAAVAAALATRGGDDDTLASDPAPTADATAEPTADPTAEPTDEPTAEPTDGATASEGECSYEPGRQPARDIEPPGPDVDTETPYRAVLVTDQGDIPFDLRTADAPCTVHSFRHLAAEDFLDDTPCHRLTDRGIFVLQCGDPSGTGTGGPGYTFADENLTEATYERGTVAMANSGPDTNGSQFFLVYEDSSLPPQYTPFGTLSEEGLAVLDAIAAAGAAPPSESGNTAPNTPVQIQDFRIEPAA
jgi:peptidyl-prolyl cis-trans isomerase B (cyclophilin B)